MFGFTLVDRDLGRSAVDRLEGGDHHRLQRLPRPPFPAAMMSSYVPKSSSRNPVRISSAIDSFE
jgi:hypothetical protein